LDNKSCNFYEYNKIFDLGGAGIQTAALAFAGNDGTANTAATEEFTITGTVGIKTITVS
jgi:hypothetical protein